MARCNVLYVGLDTTSHIYKAPQALSREHKSMSAWYAASDLFPYRGQILALYDLIHSCLSQVIGIEPVSWIQPMS
jgi:hypothetical protein